MFNEPHLELEMSFGQQTVLENLGPYIQEVSDFSVEICDSEEEATERFKGLIYPLFAALQFEPEDFALVLEYLTEAYITKLERRYETN